ISPEVCDNRFDDDRDGATDCRDTDCRDHPSCAAGPELCDNGQDDDRDGLIDCEDSDCLGESTCSIETHRPVALYLGPGVIPSMQATSANLGLYARGTTPPVLFAGLFFFPQREAGVDYVETGGTVGLGLDLAYSPNVLVAPGLQSIALFHHDGFWVGGTVSLMVEFSPEESDVGFFTRGEIGFLMDPFQHLSAGITMGNWVPVPAADVPEAGDWSWD
ncbi:MAG: hypothetical protein QGG40_22390, partial [Myxococcota bacterium]|nr:hypothetical protein [Myxococcota bacterium]